MLPLRIGSFTPAAPVVLAPMAGVTNRAFRTMCRSFGPDLVYVNEMVMANAVVYRNDKTQTMMQFAADESPRSLQVYGSDPDMLGRAVHQLCDEGRVDHVDINFGCPAAKVTRKGGGAAVPAKPALLAASIHDEEECLAAREMNVDFMVMGHVLDTPSHPDTPGMGWERFQALAYQAGCPVYAIGGRSADTLETAKSHSAHGIAFMRADI